MPASAPTGRDLLLRGRTFAPGKTGLLAIINRTPDSFYDQRRATFDDDAALEAVERAVADGADVVDIGGVKAGPGAEVNAAEELRRTVAVRRGGPRGRTRSSSSASTPGGPRSPTRSCAAGADLLNDAWAGARPGAGRGRRRPGARLVCTHAGGLPPRTDPHRVRYDDVVGRRRRATCSGWPSARWPPGSARTASLIDPAHDFGKNTQHSLELTRRLGELVATGWPVLVALSNKDFIGETLDLNGKKSDRVTGTLAATAVSAWLGARVFRAHEVAETRQVLDMVAGLRSGVPALARGPSPDAAPAQPTSSSSPAGRTSDAVSMRTSSGTSSGASRSVPRQTSSCQIERTTRSELGVGGHPQPTPRLVPAQQRAAVARERRDHHDRSMRPLRRLRQSRDGAGGHGSPGLLRALRAHRVRRLPDHPDGLVDVVGEVQQVEVGRR